MNELYEKAWFYRDSNIVDSSYIYFNLAKEQALKEKDKTIIAKSLINMAIISSEKGDYFASQDMALSVIQYLNTSVKEDKELLSTTYNELGNVSHALNKFEEANDFYQKAINLTNDDNVKTKYLNNIANNYSYQKKYTKSIATYNQILEMEVVKADENNYVRILSNYAKTKWLQNPKFNAAPILLKALQVRIKNENFIGQNASYAHLSIFYKKDKPDSALYFANKMYTVAKKNNRASDQLEALNLLIELTPNQISKNYFKRHHELLDSLLAANNNDKNQFALIRYETEKHKANNLLLKQENSTKKYQLIILIFIVSISAITGILWYKKRKQKIALQTANTIKENQLKMSKKVHDVVANGLYRIMTKLDNYEKLKDDTIVDEIEELYEKSRDISYEKENTTLLNFNEKLSSLLASFAAINTKVLIIGNNANMWLKLNDKAKYELEHILQELMVNMKKHSQAKNVIIKFSVINHQFIINYKDDGVGMPEKIIFNNGLTNTGNRINSLFGVLNFEPNNGKGINIIITFPIA